MMKKIIPVVIALLLILIIGGVYYGEILWDKYSYGKELADLDEYYKVTEGHLAIILQDEMVEEQALVTDNTVYFDMNTVYKYLNEGFYVDTAEQKILYTTAVETIVVPFGSKSYVDGSGGGQTEYTICYSQGDTVYLAADFVKRFTNYEYTRYDRHLQVYTEWGAKQIMDVSKNTQLRTLGGIKSPILCELEKGEKVEVLKQMETWSLVKTSDSVIGYVENKRLTNLSSEIETPVTDYTAPEYTSVRLEEKLSLAWHGVYNPKGGSSTLNDQLAECKVSGGGYGINVIAPTWFSLSDNQGGFRSYAEISYVEKVHDRGIQVWGVWDDFNYAVSEDEEAVSTYRVLSSTTARQRLVEDIVNTSLELGLDGVNIDFEELTEDCERHFVQFLRELSVLCRQNGLILSVDNPVPFNFNSYYRLDIQGEILDYVIIMGYDEHWGGSQDPGSVASINFVSDGLDKTLEQVPAEKVVNALPFYMRIWKTEEAGVTSDTVSLKYVSRYMDEAVWDEETCQYYKEWEDGSAFCQMWMEDEESIGVKLNVMRAHNVKNTAVWRLDFGTPAAWQMIWNYTHL